MGHRRRRFRRCDDRHQRRHASLPNGAGPNHPDPRRRPLNTSVPANPIGALNALNNDISVPAPYGNAGRNAIYRLRDGIERFFITDINNPSASAVGQSSIVTMFDIINSDPHGNGASYNHVPGGVNALYMDGHVEFHRYQRDGKYPYNQLTADLINFGSQAA